LSRRVVLLIISVLLLIGLVGGFLNVTAIEVLLRRSLAAVVPQQVQDFLRPFRAPMVIGFSPEWEAADVPLGSPVTIAFLTPMNAESALANVTIEPAVEGKFSWRGATLVFTPSEDWPMETEVTVSVSREARSWLMRRMERGFAFSFTTLGAPFVLATTPAQDARYAYLQDRLTITFNRPMDQQSVESRLSVSPEIVDQRLAWQEDQLIITGVLSPSTEYLVTIGQGAQDAAYGMRTLEVFEWSFVTTERSPYLVTPGVGKELLVTSGMSSTLELRLSNVSRVDASLYALDMSAYITMTNFSSDDWRQFTPEQAAISSWSMDPQATLDQDERRDLELEPLEPGLYYLAVGSPEGAGDGQILISSGTALTLKRTASQALVWATSIGEGEPVADLTVQLYDARGRLLATGTSDEEGLFLTELTEPPQRVYALAEGNGDLSLCSDRWDEGIEPWRFEGVIWGGVAPARRYRPFLYTDRPTYSPGQEVNFRGVFQVDNDGTYQRPEAGTMIDVVASNYQGDVIYEGDLETSPFGTVHGSFPLDEQVKDGDYVLQATVGGEQSQIAFRVEQFQQEPFAVDWEMDRDVYMTGDTISGTLTAEYEFGIPVKGASVDYTVYASEYSLGDHEAAAQPGPCEGLSCVEYGREVTVGHGLTDGEGRLQFALSTDPGAQGGNQLYALEASVTDDAGMEVTSATTTVVLLGEFQIELAPERAALLTGERAVVGVSTTDGMGKALGELDLSYTIQVSEWEPVPESAGGIAYISQREIATEVERSSTTTDGSGRAIISFIPRQGGVYRVQAWGRDRRGHRMVAAAELWVGDPNRWVAWPFSEQDRILLVPDKESYSPAETARVLIQSPYERAIGLVTVESGAILSHWLVRLGTNSELLEIPLDAAYAPNVFLSLTLVPQGGDPTSPPSFKVGYAELAIESTDERLEISLIPDRDIYEPGQLASFTIRTRDHRNQPVSAELSLAVVDESIQSPAEDERLDLVDAFYGRRRLAVQTAQTLAVYVGRSRVLEDYGGGGGRGEQEPPLKFPDLAYWNPAVVTDESGVAHVSLQIPGRVASWKVFARGVTPAGVMGAADLDVTARKPLALTAHIPSFLYVGDVAIIRALIENTAGHPVSVQVSLDTSGGLWSPAVLRSMSIEAGGSASLEWTIEARQAGPATLTLVADGGEDARDAYQGVVSVLAFGEHTTVTDAAVVEDQGSQILTVPGNTGLRSLAVDIAPSLMAALVSDVEYLTSQEAASVEDIVGRFLPGLLVKQVLVEQDTDGQESLSELPSLVTSSIQRLYRLRNRDGGWGWVEGTGSQTYHTAAVLLGLKVAQDAGYPVNEEVLDAGLDFLSNASRQSHDLGEKAYLTYVLSECGEGDLSLARSLLERRSRMDRYAQAYLSLALGLLDDEASAGRIADELALEVIETAHTAHWTEDQHDLAAMSSDARTTAVVLRALAAADPDHPLLAKAVAWLMWERDGGFWRGPYETAGIVEALAQYARISGQAKGAAGYQIHLDETLLAEEEGVAGEIGTHRRIVRDGLSPDEHTIRVESDGSGPLYLSTVVEQYTQEDTLEAARSLDGPRVERSYEAFQSGEALAGWTLGDLIEVRLRVEFPDDAWYVVMEDPMPPGAELVRVSPLVSAEGGTANMGLRAQSQESAQGVVFLTPWVPAGVWEYTYLVRATASGEFRVMPAEARLMYDPGKWGRSSSNSLSITSQT
jgi:uncharacterized protein YfaS (alpha-2-macroglobulin family)